MSSNDFSFDLGAIGGTKTNTPDKETVYDLLIAGGGPAAMTAAVYAARKVMNVAMLTYDFGGQMGSTSWIENYMGFQTISGQELVAKFQEQVEKFDIPILLGEKVTTVTKDDGVFKATMENGDVYQSKTFIIATGKRDRALNVPGEKEYYGKGVHYCATCDAPFYKEKDVVVVGGGNSGFTAALVLQKIANSITLINHSPGFKADKILLKTVKKYDNIKLMDNTEVTQITGHDQNVDKISIKDCNSDKNHELEADGLFVEIGLIPNSEPVRDIVQTNEFGEVIIDCNCKTSLPGMFGAGDVTTVPYKQIVISAGEGSKATLAAYDYLASNGLL